MVSLFLGLPHLVGGFSPSEKYESRLGLLFPIYGKIKFMLQTSNQMKLVLPSRLFRSRNSLNPGPDIGEILNASRGFQTPTGWGPQSSDSVQKRLKKVAEFYGLW